MIHEIKMPAAGQTTDKAQITQIYAKVGDTIKRGDVLLDAETDKAVLPVESFAVGTVLEILVEAGDEVTAGSVLMAIGPKGEQYQRQNGAPAASAAPATAEEEDDEYQPIVKKQTQKQAAPVAVAPPAAQAAYSAMPNAKKLAKELGIDLARITPANGTFISRKDVLDYVPDRADPSVDDSTDQPYEVVPVSSTRHLIGRRMQESLQTAPAFQCAVSINMEACMALREGYKARNIQISYNDILAKAISVAARKYPLLNARFEDGELRIYKHSNVGLAVALPDSLVVPVVSSVDEKGLEQIAAEYREKIEKSHSNRLAPSDMGCGSVTISNLGMYDVDHFTAIINPPESCILAVGSILVQPEWDGQSFRPVHKMTVNGSFDHRIMDGAYAAQLLQELKALMENPFLLLA